jgi:hypothetical protein
MELSEDDLFTCAAQIEKFVAGLKPPGESRYEIGQIQLATNDPESRRPEILQAIAGEVARTRKLLGEAAKVTISGLEGPVLVRQFSDREIELFIDYALSVDLK